MRAKATDEKLATNGMSLPEEPLFSKRRWETVDGYGHLWAFVPSSSCRPDLIPPAKPGGHPREVDMREVINTLLYQERAGCQCEMLPHELAFTSTAL